MAQNESLQRKNEILKRQISSMMMQNSQGGLSAQDSMLMQKFMKEMYTYSHQSKSNH